jgi:hypothetical protein
MTTLYRGQPPPPKNHKLSPGGHPVCQVCAKPLGNKFLRDPQLGPCCMECAPHVIAAEKALFFARIR